MDKYRQTILCSQMEFCELQCTHILHVVVDVFIRDQVSLKAMKMSKYIHKHVPVGMEPAEYILGQ
jgi:transcriptional antiterminator Rof (Rho-off)